MQGQLNAKAAVAATGAADVAKPPVAAAHPAAAGAAWPT
eukprot:CAMPEP_0114664136 /NCGR_PEP_ID=MMETSP0191-20121206/28222_1 /TAXON_ID=126664 /ORGANISM="Sorites sp." /LENGTH=38 /DNA_ID= /DNA_START= /DNA_END= /DNA_ORIENTATION=